MEKRYQVFVSSTYVDLKDARDAIFKTLMSMDCIPAGMELFPAMDEEQFEFIKKIIDDSDYYVLIIGGKYGSVAPDGMSYTEKEFEYARSKGIKVLAFLHSKPDDLPAKFSETDAKKRKLLDAFREKAKDGRLVNFWELPSELPGLLALSLPKTIKTYPAVGWVRANQIASDVALREQNQLHREIARLKGALKEREGRDTKVADLAKLDEPFEVLTTWVQSSSRGGSSLDRQTRFKLTWGQIFGQIAPTLQEHPAESSLKYKLAEAVFAIAKDRPPRHVTVDLESLQTIRVQFVALGLVETSYTKATNGSMALFWSLTKKGVETMMELRTVKSGGLMAIDDGSAPTFAETPAQQDA